MKRQLLLFALLLTSMAGMAQTADDLFREFKDKDGVQFVNIGKEMMDFATGFVKEQETKEVLKKMDFVRVLNIEGNKKTAQAFAKQSEKLKKGKYEPMVTTNDDGRTLILTRFEGEDICELLILTVEDDECALVQIGGKISPDDIQKLSEMTKNN
ncbi:MAG: DUF4252 domain-containing protein [Prevotella sp.]|nr:DUF4252 domain-containing protein [Prevotella sp.]